MFTPSLSGIDSITFFGGRATNRRENASYPRGCGTDGRGEGVLTGNYGIWL